MVTAAAILLSSSACFLLLFYRLNTRKCRRTLRDLVQILKIFKLWATGPLVLRY